MSSYVYMKVLESTPLRYDRGIRMLSRGAIDAVYQRVAELAAAPGARVLDVGCGTGNLSCACAARGADVVAVDSNAGMLDVARRKAAALDGPGRVELVQLDAMELEDRFEATSFDAAVSCLLFSELQPEERAYVLETLRTRVRPGGVVVIADEVAPESVGARAWWSLMRAPLVAVTWLLTQTTTHAVGGLSEMLEARRVARRHAARRGGIGLSDGSQAAARRMRQQAQHRVAEPAQHVASCGTQASATRKLPFMRSLRASTKPAATC